MVKMGRTQLQDAVPIRLGQEFARLCVGAIRRDIKTGWTRRPEGNASSSTWAALPSAPASTSTLAYLGAASCRPAVRDDRASPLSSAVDLIDATQNTGLLLSLCSALIKACAVEPVQNLPMTCA